MAGVRGRRDEVCAARPLLRPSGAHRVRSRQQDRRPGAPCARVHALRPVAGSACGGGCSLARDQDVVRVTPLAAYPRPPTPPRRQPKLSYRHTGTSQRSRALQMMVALLKEVRERL
eukprot:358544-Prymnesium_polylepis.1